ncbi:hydrolase (plasmid) [Deinococcus wulumuqiensis]|uniref:Hydrolase n=1 Tax=Deinococcus wulumuqiensis TaxID=980427 RepID=A0A345ILX5_9DEIO|nr:DUF2227 family putative metal-binding protein [Deinococcus wulumuqiensis]AXH00698.1 hydrolase [Deinococcus wulumuqiensis]
MHGYQHTALNLATTSVVAAALTLLGHPQTAAAVSTGMVFGTLLVTPDLDLHYNDARRNWGALKAIWAPYAAMSTHRGINHTYLAGPLLRLLYLAFWFAVPVYLLWQWPAAAAWAREFPREMLFSAFLGYLMSQWLHLLCDGIIPFQQRKRPRPARGPLSRTEQTRSSGSRWSRR